jgi:putative oxidoreductase
MEFLKRWSEPIYAATRIVVGFLFLCHGIQKLQMALGGGDLPMPAPVFWLATSIETLCGAMVMVGLFTGFAGFLASGMMAVAYFGVHQPRALLPIENQGELAALYCWAFLLIASRGSGLWSVDAVRARP